MAYIKKTISLGNAPNDGEGSPLRTGGGYIDDNFDDLYAKLGDGFTIVATQFGRDMLAASNSAAGRSLLGLGTMAVQNADNVNITGGTISGVSGIGTVTSVDSGTGLTGGPITSTGTLALANTAVTPGAYTSANITVDQQGRITAAASGGDGAGTVTNVATGTGLTGGPITTTGTIALANTAVSAGSYTLSSLTVDAQGRLTAVSSGTAVTSVGTGTGLSGGPITSTGTVSLANTAVTPATYTLATITVDQQGRITSASNGSAGSGTVTSVAAGTGLSASPSPIVGAGTISMNNTAVTPGSYTLSSLTVDAQGRLTSASSGTAVTSVATGAGLTGGAITTTGTVALATIANSRVFANVSGGAAVPSANTLSDVLDIAGTTRGSILYRGASGWAILAPGTATNVLTSNGAGADPSYAAAATPVLNNYIAGLGTSNNAGTPNTKIDVAAGQAADSTNAVMMSFSGAAKTVDFTASGANGLDTGAIAANTWYAILLISGVSGTAVMATQEFAGSPISPTMPAGYTSYRYIGSVKTDGSSHLIPYFQAGQFFYWKTSITDVNISPTPTSATLFTLTVPPSVQVFPLMTASFSDGVANYLMVFSPSQATVASPAYKVLEAIVTNVETGASLPPRYLTDNRARLYYSGTAAISSIAVIVTNGWVDPHVASVF